MDKAFTYLLLLLLPTLAMSQEVVKKKDKYYTPEGEVFTGTFTKHYENQKVKAEFNIEKGLLDGKSVVYFKEGTKKEIRSYKNGKMDGIWKTWNEEGVKVARAVYENGKKDGTWKIWDDNGTLRFKMKYENGKKTGTWYNYDKNGNLVATKEFGEN